MRLGGAWCSTQMRLGGVMTVLVGRLVVQSGAASG
jgi:hypothetical protein